MFLKENTVIVEETTVKVVKDSHKTRYDKMVAEFYIDRISTGIGRRWDKGIVASGEDQFDLVHNDKVDLGLHDDVMDRSVWVGRIVDLVLEITRTPGIVTKYTLKLSCLLNNNSSEIIHISYQNFDTLSNEIIDNVLAGYKHINYIK